MGLRTSLARKLSVGFDSLMVHQMIEEKIAAKKAEIEHYEGVLARYGSGRWLDMGRRHLAELKEELSELHHGKKERQEK